MKIAVGSDGGWETVRQYQSNPVASDSDDETKINKTDNRALRKHNSKGKKAVVKPNNGGQNTSSQYVATFPAENQPFRESQTWYNVPALYHGHPMPSTRDVSAEVNNKEYVMAVDLSKTGEANVRSFPDQPCQNQNKTEFIKNKNSLITTGIKAKI